MQIQIFKIFTCNPCKYYLYMDPHIFCESKYKSKYENINVDPNLDFAIPTRFWFKGQ